MNHQHRHSDSPSSAAPALVRHCDVAVVGGSAAGLAAALQLGRQRRSVIVIDSGEPRNAAAVHMHSFLGRDGTDPGELLAAGRAEVRSYGGEVLSGRALRVRRDGGRFVVELATGDSIVARRIVVATGLVDELPDVEGLAAHWGQTVIHCPFCHGYEVRDQRLVQLVTHAVGLHVVPLLRQLSDRLTVLIADGVEINESDVDTLTAGGVDVRVATTAKRVLTDADGRLTGVELDDGTPVDADAILVGPRFHARVEPFAGLGLYSTPHATGMGEVIEVDAMGATAVDGIFAAGSITDPGQQVLPAAAHGSRVGAVVAMSLAGEDTQVAARPSGSVADWDHRYSGDPVWSGNPNGSLVAEVAGLDTGRALDVGAGEGGDAIWLAEQGWEVTASDISSRALDRIQAEAGRRDLPIMCELADANAREPFARARFDLVSAAYASIPRTPDLRGVHNLLDAVALDGTLLILSHDIEAMRDPKHQHRPFDPDAYLRIDDFVAVLKATPGWTIEINDKRSRPAGSASAAHHADDRVLRARRAS
ncbi:MULTISPECIES: bifunctional NAD(P)/FAD-dependent oxidoreductase/class I SAM-dependent methyltransferase [Arthrobacter]|uniref:NAD(P)/FAD-dependent oxidoreductase n=1 Tax=Arthrobacter terricola TaxID=2547396 RepID=A0A4R5K6Q3_9MICC|nr:MULTISPECIES: bifunctional NAD(P)/FAD-dependent oxidoreductase/class I SAM-dependent methyltransferase [Arthrobacter]MBT8163776.1 NAD(P)/FAD-dependent oxidoreductase [Arthrobacter sp. GN70]TDF87027.1 NAD(P)/FAD-dependent oxidoreductase [Arthrobacter terricola]